MRSAIVVALAAVLVAAGTPAAHAVTAPAGPDVNRKPALMVLNALPVSPERMSGYDRDLFPTWIVQGGCDTREDVLIAERLAGTVSGCSVMGGRWRSAYDGVVTSDPGSFDVDHRVPLADAWASGAWRWDADTRTRYANDLGFGPGLIAVSASSNRSKGDRDPAEWMPPLASQRCGYVKSWIAVKYRWGLAVDAAEKSALSRLLVGCPPLLALPQRAPVGHSST